MKTSLILAGALALALVPGALLLPGCGGGGGGSSRSVLTYGQQFGVEFLNFPELSAVLSVNYQDTASSAARATGTLRVFANTANPLPTPIPGAGAVVGFAPGTYILTGNVTGTNQTGNGLDLRGAYSTGQRFTLTSNSFAEGGTISIKANFNAGPSELIGRLTNVALTPAPISTSSPNPNNTPTTVSTPVTTSTSAPISTAMPISTAVPTLTPMPTLTAMPTTTPIPTATTFPTPGGAGGGTTNPPQLP